ncbi:MAG: protoporphyrinogen oxidase HemJ [Rhizobiales bacterium]|nr:protoporphyrinogen oxidase HemJ [Hyphomicrobiales bacterium]MBO6699506.1 protoporphyrinogen oxidase HemJ [Hyphomicrobiales bacterium]MBO6737044.1 protoporphyrinogen oxidase HemJ [Hyphomicrobiales bacterium]MBO6911882.1 protoporphyrinogen oxidase HemJ [Hyphomicrobiales bacterium]MBO6954818.1 protoporphyrinogen oxidase HemJ [Hyphomicrobiales bacterium]
MTAGMVFLIPAGAYLWMKALHVIAVIAWMAGLLYLPRLFVYHVDAEVGSVQSEMFKTMERRLLKAIMTPAMIVSALTGFWLAIVVHGFQGGWLHAKLVFILILFAMHGHLAASVRRFAGDRNEKSSRYWRFMNEVPTLAMIIIVVLVIVQPF